MTTIRRTTEIRLLISANPHRIGTMDWIRFNLIRDLIGQNSNTLVGYFIDRHNAHGGVGNTWNAKRYLRYMVERGQMQLPGITFPPRAPRERRQAVPAILLPIASELDDFTFGVEIECFIPSEMSRNEV